MSKSFKKVLWGFYALIVFSAFFSSCDVGLGESVDVIAPTVSINYPPASVVIREGFLLKGSWADDKGVYSVQVTVKNDDTGKTYGTYTAGLGLFDLSWSLSLNNKDENGNFPFPDGKYTVDVVATDTSGRTSGTASRSFEIDNTAPIFVIKNPGTFSISSPSKYGSVFKVNGSIAEAHSVKEMLLTIYDSNGNKITSWSESNVNTAGGTSVTFASYDSTNTSLSNNYKAVYNDETGGDQSFYCSVQLTDSAAVYNGSSSEGGNTTSSLWVNDSIYGSEATTVINGNTVSADLLSKNAAHQYEIGDFLSIYNGTYSGSGNASSALQILEATKKDTTENKLAFSLNKDANPTYTFLGYSFDSTAASNKASKSGAITFKAECGLNETNFKPKTIKVYLIGPYESTDGTNPLTTSFVTTLYENVESFVEDSSNAEKIYTLYNGEEVYSSTECTSVSSWTESMELPDEIVSGGYYLLAATGIDIDEVEFVSNNGSTYGFIGVTSGTAPNVIIDTAAGVSLDTALDSDYNSLEFLTVTGSVKSAESNIAAINYEVTVKDLSDGTTVGVITGSATCNQDLNANKEIDFSFDACSGTWTENETYLATYGSLDARDISTLSGKLLSYTVVVSGIDVTAATGKANFTAQFDKLSPSITINSITPLAEEKTVNSVSKKCVNGIVTVVARITETNLDSVSVIASTNTGSDSEKSTQIDLAEASAYITVKFDTRVLDDSSDLSIKVIATDKAGNEGSLTNSDYYIDQSTDIPKIKLAGVTQTLTDASAITVGTNLFGMGNNTLYGTISDDDGLSNIKIYYSDSDQSFDDAVLKTTITSDTLSGTTTYSLNEDLSACGAGNHKIYIIAEDTSTAFDSNGDEVDSHSISGSENSSDNPYGMVFAYDNDLPEISVSGIIKGEDSTVEATSYSSGIWLPQNFIVKGTAVDSSGITKVVVKDDTTALGSGDGTSSTNPYSWNETLTSQTDTETGGQTRTYVAYDIYGRSSECKITYNIDSTVPVFNPEYITVSGTVSSQAYSASLAEVLSAGTCFNGSAIKISGTVSNDTSQTAYGLVEANLDTIYVVLNGTTVTCNPTVSDGFSVTLTFPEGAAEKMATFDMTDKAGNAAETLTFGLNVDLTAPTLTITSPDSVSDYETEVIEFTGTVADSNFDSLEVQYKRKYAEYDSENKKTVIKTEGSESYNYIVTVPISVNSDNTWSWTMPGDGDYTSIKFVTSDTVGNTAYSDTYSIIVDKQVPSVVNESTSTDWTSNNSPSLRLLVGDWGSEGTAYSSGIKSITYTGIGSGSIDNRGALTAKADDTDGKKIYYTYTADFSNLSDGSHSVTVLVTDEAGNSTTSANIATYNIDTVSPYVEASLNINNDTEYQRTQSDETTYYAVTYSADDTTNSASSAVSGIKSLSVLNASGSAISISTSSDGSDSATSITLSSETGVTSVSDRTFYIPATAIAEGTNVFSVTVTDYAGNSGKCDITIHYDSTAPVVSYSTPLSGATVYKKINITGSVADAVKVSASGYESGVEDSEDSLVKVEYISSSGTPDWSNPTVLTKGSDYDSITLSSGVWTLNNLDTSLIEDDASGTACNYYIRLVFQDTYGNKNADNGLLLAINQDADRPVISLTTISSMDEVISARTIYGNVTDSDGSLQNLWVIDSSKFDSSASFSSDGVPVTTGDNAWTKIENLSTSGSWSYNLGSTSSESDRSYSFYFAVEDNKGDIFYTNTGDSGADKLKRPKLAFSGVEVSNAVDNNTALTFSVDTVPPKITMYTANSELAADAVDSNNNTAWTAAGLLLGGSQNKLYIKLEVIEDNLTDTTTVPGLTIAGQTVTPTFRTAVTGSGTSDSPYIYLLNAITLDSATYSSLEGSKSVMATLSDDSGQEGQGATNIILDYTAPEVSIITPTATISDAVMAATTVKGTVADTYSSISKLEYVIPLTSESYTATSSNWTSVYTSGSSWEISFTSGSAESIDSLCYYGANYSDYEGAKEVSTGLGIYRIPFWFRVTDSVGNVGVISVDSSNEPLNYVYVDPEGGKPKAWINAPETGTVTSGTVTLYGGASDNVSVSKVCVQIDADGDGDIDETDYSVIATDSSAYCTGTLVASSSSDANDWYILAEGTNSWKCPIVTGSLGAYTGTAYTAATSPYGIAIESGKKYLFARVRAIDGDGNTRTYTDCNAIVIDSTVPWFTDVKVCQYGPSYVDVNTDPDISSSSVSAKSEREYISGMYLSDVTSSTNGYWYLVATVQSNSDITSITSATLSSTSQTVIDLSKDGKTTYVSDKTKVAHAVKNSATEYILTIPLETTSSGVIYAELTATNGVGNGNQTIKINIDSTSPSVYNTSGSEITTTTESLRLKSQSKVVGVNGTDNSTTYSTIENSDGYFTFGDTINEAGSGLLYLAFWFKNTSESSVYDPMLSKSASSFVDSATNGSVYLNSEKLPALYLTGVTRSSEYTFTSASVSGNAHVRVGGLVKIAGTYRRISAVSDDGTVTFSPSVSTSFETVEVIYAQVVDHMISETFGEEYDANDDVYVTLQNDDGDGMCETINQIGTSYQWTASVNSNNIPDGTTEIYVTAIDNAGNSSNGKIASIVTNNRPRLTKVFLGTDLNGNGTYDFDAEDYPVVSTSSSQRTRSGTSFGEFNYYTAYNTRSGLGQSAVKIDSTAFKVISGLCVLPEFTGGNGSLKYVVEKKDSSNYTLAAETSGTLNAMTARAALPIATTGSLDMYGTVTSTNEDGNTNPIAYSGTDINGVTYYDFGGIVLTDSSSVISGSDGAVNYVKFTFWDETDGKQSDFKSQWATLVVPVTIKSSDSTAPEPKIKPFYWNSSTDNSVYIDSAIAGHIELENDITSDISSASVSGTEMGSDDPKVSGKVKLEGIVSDDVRLADIKLSVFGGTSTVVGSYSSGTWTQASSLPTGVVSFSASDQEISQNGHEAKYSIVIDTEEFTVGLDKNIVITAVDWKGNTSTAGSTQTASDALTDCYKMDVVPYVTEIVTNLSSYSLDNPSVYARSSVGSYPVYEGETITFKGYNLGSGKASVVMNGKTVTLDSSNQTTVDSSVSSGSVSVSVNDILAVNNINTSDAKGAYSGSASDNGYANCYNRQPNGVNNNMLTDDLALDVWNFKTAASPVGSSANYVHMKVGPYLSSDTANSGRIGFSFKNAIGYFNMPGQKSNSAEQDYYTGKFTFQISSETYKYVHFYNATQGDKNYTAAGSWPGDAAVYNSSGYYEITYDSIKYNSGDSLIVILNNGSGTQTGKYTLSGPGLYRWTSYSSSDASKSYSTPYTETHVTVPAGITFSQTRFGTNYGGFNHNTFAFDSIGYTYGAAQCPDTSGTSGMSANFQFFSRAVYDESSDYHGLNYNYFNVTNGRRIENTSYYKGSAVYTDENRVQNPEMATYVSDSTSYVYLAYYDHGLDMIKFRIGSVGSTANDIDLGLQDLDKFTSNNYSSDDSNKICVSNGNLRDSLDSSYVGNNGDAYKYVTNIADSGASPYVAVGALPTDGTAVVVWYDKNEQALKMRTATFNSVTSTAVSWTDSEIISSVGGKYVSMATDEAGGIHLAYLSNSGANLYYTYLSSVSSTPVTMLVDAYQDVGDRCMITVGRESTSKPWIPYISYKSNYASHTKIAYPVFADDATASTTPSAGIVDGTEKFTGNWNVSLIPDTSLSIDDTISVGVHKDWASGSGVMYDFPTGSTVSASDTGVYSLCDATVVYGNGTANPVMGYAVEDGTIQMAQKK